MPKYRVKSIEVDAYQLTEESLEHVHDWPGWLQKAHLKEEGDFRFYSAGKGRGMFISTPDGPLKVSTGDWIVRSSNDPSLVPFTEKEFALMFEEF